MAEARAFKNFVRSSMAIEDYNREHANDEGGIVLKMNR